MPPGAITSKTRLCAIIGKPIEHSLSPLVHNLAFEHLNLDYVFLAFEVERLREAIEGIRALQVRGVSVTIPHKVEVLNYLDEVEAVAKRIGAVNTIVNQKGHLIGYNTDCLGAIRALEERTVLRDKKVALLGAGGAARAIAFGLREKGAKVAILNRTLKKAEALAGMLGCDYGTLEEVASFAPEIIVNTTSVGMFPHAGETPVRKEELKGDILVFDSVYNPLETRLLREAQERGCQVILGLEMFVNQAALQFELWTGEKAPLEFMKKVVKEKLS